MASAHLPKASIKTNEVFVVDFSVAAAQEDELVDAQACVSFLTIGAAEADCRFVKDLMERTCMYGKQFLPKHMQKLALLKKEEYSGTTLDLNAARLEAEQLLGRTLDDLFERSGVDASQVDVFACMSTQMTDLQLSIHGAFGIRDDAEIMMLGGMGCAAGVAGIDFADKLLSEREVPTTMVIVCHENVTRGMYTGLARDSLVSAALFRAGATAMLFTTDPELAKRAKFTITATTRTYQTDDKSFWAMGYKLDNCGMGGIYLPKKEDLGDISARAISRTLIKIGRKVLPIREKVKYVLSGGTCRPNFLKGVDRVMVHPGGPAVIDKVGKAVGYDAAVFSVNSINAYYYYGNTSSGGTLYSLAYSEAIERIPKGNRCLILGLGAGFESNAVVLTALRDCADAHPAYKMLIDNPAMQPLAVDAFVRGYRNRERLVTFDMSDERRVRDLISMGKGCGYVNLYGPEPASNSATSSNDLLRKLVQGSSAASSDDGCGANGTKVDREVSSATSSQVPLGLRTPERGATAPVISDD